MEYILPFLCALAIAIVIFLVFRAIVLWYWKVNIIVELLNDHSKILSQLADENRTHLRISYYTALAVDDKAKAHENLLRIVFIELLKNDSTAEQRFRHYHELKEKYHIAFEKTGYPFPGQD
jgi:hypothetical protein